MSLSDRLKKFELYNDETENSAVSPELAALCTELTKMLSKKIATIPIWFDYTKEEQQELILNFLNAKLNEQFSEIKLTTAEKERISENFFSSIYGFGSLDFLIAQKEISKIFVNSPSEIYTEYNNEIVKNDVIIDDNQFKSLINRLIDMSGKNSSVITFRLNNLLITILQEPVCKTKLILKKISDVNFNFEYFEHRDILNEDISSFLRILLNNKARILISSPVQCGKTAFLNSFINETDSEISTILFEEGALINTNRKNINRFDAETLTEKEQRELITAALYYKPEFVFSDINSIGFNIEISDLLNTDTGLISTVRANSPAEALSFYTSILVSRLKCTEKLAKMQFAKDYNYIIQLEKNGEFFVIKSIVEISTNKAGTPIFTPKLEFKSGQYKYDFHTPLNKIDLKAIDEKEVKKQSEVKPEKIKKITFSTRFNK